MSRRIRTTVKVGSIQTLLKDAATGDVFHLCDGDFSYRECHPAGVITRAYTEPHTFRLNGSEILCEGQYVECWPFYKNTVVSRMGNDFFFGGKRLLRHKGSVKRCSSHQSGTILIEGENGLFLLESRRFLSAHAKPLSVHSFDEIKPVARGFIGRIETQFLFIDFSGKTKEVLRTEKPVLGYSHWQPFRDGIALREEKKILFGEEVLCDTLEETDEWITAGVERNTLVVKSEHHIFIDGQELAYPLPCANLEYHSKGFVVEAHLTEEKKSRLTLVAVK
ncbi:MAG: hypothetical protein Q7S15_01935 [bacterium]|nr:hypothetical protein [bacterium]